MPKRNRQKEEFWNAVTHGAGALLSVVGATAIIGVAAVNGKRLDVVASVIFGVSLVLLYLASTIYHAVHTLRWKRIFQRIDHLCIYLLIAGTYTPVALLGLRGTWGWVLFGLSWAFAAAGFLFKFSSLGRSGKLSLALYVLMGWMAVVAVKPLIDNVAPEALLLILAGGLSYTLGIYFYAKEKVPYFHTVWHVFVLGGSAFHFFGIFLYLIP